MVNEMTNIIPSVIESENNRVCLFYLLFWTSQMLSLFNVQVEPH